MSDLVPFTRDDVETYANSHPEGFVIRQMLDDIAGGWTRRGQHRALRALHSLEKYRVILGEFGPNPYGGYGFTSNCYVWKVRSDAGVES